MEIKQTENVRIINSYFASTGRQNDLICGDKRHEVGFNLNNQIKSSLKLRQLMSWQECWRAEFI